MRYDGNELRFHLLYPLAFGDVLLDGNEIYGLSDGILNRSDGLILIIKATIFAPIDDLTVPNLPGSNGIPEILLELLILFA